MFRLCLLAAGAAAISTDAIVDDAETLRSALSHLRENLKVDIRAADAARHSLRAARDSGAFRVSGVSVGSRASTREALMDAAEHLAGPSGWGYDSVFLHVHEENPAALGLYEALAYEKLDALDEAPLRYFYKRLSEYAPSSSEVVAAAGRLSQLQETMYVHSRVAIPPPEATPENSFAGSNAPKFLRPGKNLKQTHHFFVC